MTSAGIVAANDIDYYNVENSFIHLALEGRPSLPITMAVIFSGIANRYGISAAPINYVHSAYSYAVLTQVASACICCGFKFPNIQAFRYLFR